MIMAKVEGLDELIKNCQQMEEIIKDVNRKVTDENLKQLVIDSREKAPYKTGTLKRSIDKRIIEETDSSVTGEYGSDEKYAAIQELGGVVKPKNGKYLVFNKDGKTIFTRKPVYIPARPYLMPALIEGVDAILWRYKKAWEILKDLK